MAKKAFTARNKMMDYLAQRDHSEKEIRKKLASFFNKEDIDLAVQFGKENGWLPNSPEDLQRLSKKYSSTLSRKKKGIKYIQSKLKEIGLPEVEFDPQLELEKALILVKNKYSFNASLFNDCFEEKQKWRGKVVRFLQSRGFEIETIKKALELFENLNKNSKEGLEDDFQS